MIVFELIIIASSLFCLYEYATYTELLHFPYIHLSGNENIFFLVTKVCVMKYSFIFGILGILFSIFSIAKLAENYDFVQVRFKLMIFYFILGMLMLL